MLMNNVFSNVPVEMKNLHDWLLWHKFMQDGTFKKIPDDQKLEKFGKLSKSEESTRGIFFECDADLRKEILKQYIFDNDSNIDTSVNLFKSLGFMDLLEYTEKSQQLPREYIHKLIEKDKSISTRVLLFDPSVDRNKIIELQQNNQLTSSTAIDINSVLSSIYNDNNISIEEFNDKLDDIYRIFTYNNIPNFLKTFRLFQVGNFYNKTNSSLVSIQNKTPQENVTEEQPAFSAHLCHFQDKSDSKDHG